MANRTFKALAQGDAEACSMFEQLAEELEGWNEFKVTVRPFDNNAGHFSVPVENARDKVAEYGNLPAANSISLAARGENDQNMRLSVQVVREGYTDEIVVNMSDNVGQEPAARVLNAVASKLSLCSDKTVFEEVIGADVAAQLKQHEGSTQALNRALNDLIETSTGIYKANETELQERRKALAEEFEGIRQRHDEEIEKKRQAIREREAELDDSDNTTARRRLRDDYKNAIQETRKDSSLLKGRFKRSLPIHFVFVAIAATLGYFAFSYSLSFTKLLEGSQIDPSSLWVVGTKSALATLGFASIAVYYIRWMDAAAKRAEREEVRMDRSLVDIDRASWLVEVVLEWKKAYNDASIPSELVDRLSSNLFLEEGESPDASHPTEEALAALLGATASAKAKLPGGGEINFDRKSVKEAKKTSSS